MRKSNIRIAAIATIASIFFLWLCSDEESIVLYVALDEVFDGE